MDISVFRWLGKLAPYYERILYTQIQIAPFLFPAGSFFELQNPKMDERRPWKGTIFAKERQFHQLFFVVRFDS